MSTAGAGKENATASVANTGVALSADPTSTPASSTHKATEGVSSTEAAKAMASLAGPGLSPAHPSHPDPSIAGVETGHAEDEEDFLNDLDEAPRGGDDDAM